MDQNQDKEIELGEETAKEAEVAALPHDSFDTDIKDYTSADLEAELAPRATDEPLSAEAAAPEEQLIEAESDLIDPGLEASEMVEADQTVATEGEAGGPTQSEIFYTKCDLPLKAQVEAVLFASPKCLNISEIAQLVLIPEERFSEVESAVQELVWEYQQRAGGFRLEGIRGHGYQFRTISTAAPLMKRMFATRPRPLSRASLETLSIIAYRQPCTRAEIEYIRGVDAGSIIKHLLERNLIACVGRKEEAGRPMLFGTTQEFLQVFGFSSVRDLPSLASFQASTETIQTTDSANPDARPEEIELATGDFMDHSEEGREVEVSSGMIDAGEVSVEAGDEPVEASEVAMDEAELGAVAQEAAPIESNHEVEAANETAAPVIESEETSEEVAEAFAHSEESVESSAPVKIQGAMRAESFDSDDDIKDVEDSEYKPRPVIKDEEPDEAES
jgi:segregation and condensation protein B